MGLLILSLGIFSCTKDSTSSNKNSSIKLKHWGEWTGETKPGKYVNPSLGTNSIVDCDIEDDATCYKMVGSGMEDWQIKEGLGNKGWAFKAALLSSDVLYLKPYIFKDALTESNFLSQSKYIVSYDQIIDFPLTGSNIGKKLVLKKGEYNILPPLSNDHKAYIELNVQIIE